MFPKLKSNFSLKCKKCTNVLTDESENTSLFFTGGLDATSALTEVKDSKPLLINIWGGDVFLNDYSTHDALDKYMNELCKEMGNSYCFLKSNCRTLIKEGSLDAHIRQFVRRSYYHGYWASVGHIVVMTAVIAPLLYMKKINRHYIGSTYKEKSGGFDGNSEMMACAIRFFGCENVLIDSDLTRNDKARKVVEFKRKSGLPIKLNVCWYRKDGINCSKCEKCCRTMMNIILGGGNPNEFGFKFDNETSMSMKNYLSAKEVNKDFWKQIKKDFCADSSLSKKYPAMRWMNTIKINPLRIYVILAKNKLRLMLRKR